MFRLNTGIQTCLTLAILACTSPLSAQNSNSNSTTLPPQNSPTPTDPNTSPIPLILEDSIRSTTRSSDRPLNQVPYSASVLHGGEIRSERMAASLPEALLDTPGVMVQQTTHGQGSPYIRGFTGFRTALMVDGIRLNNSTFRDGPNQYLSTVDALAIDRLEVVRGPGSVLYGSDAIGGVVNALFRGPRYGTGETPLWGGSTYYRFGSAERGHLGRAEFTGSSEDRWGMAVGLSGKTFGDLQGGHEVRRQDYTGYDQWDVDAKVDYFFKPHIKLTLAHQSTDQYDISRTHRLIYAQSWEGTTVGTDRRLEFDQHRDLTYARLEIETPGGDRIQGTISWQNQDEVQFQQRNNFTRQESITGVGTLGVSLQSVTPSRWGEWTYGVDYYRDYVNSSQRNFDANGVFTSEAVQGPVADDSNYDLVGVFVQDEIPIADRLHLIVGGRYTHAGADAGRYRDPVTGLAASLDDSWDTGVGTARLNWNPDVQARWQVFGGVSQGFRAPNLSDLTRFDIARTGEIETAAPGLDPERFLTLESGVSYADRRWRAGVSLFHTLIQDMIVRAPTGNTVAGNAEVTKRNAAEGYVHGLELDGELELGHGLALHGMLTWQEGEADAYATSAAAATRAPLSRVAPLTGLAGMRWTNLDPKVPLFVELYGILSAKQDRLSPEDQRDTQRIPPGGTPGWATLNVRVGYDWKGRVKAVAAVENLLNEDYRIHGSGFNQPGRNFKFSLSYHF